MAKADRLTTAHRLRAAIGAAFLSLLLLLLWSRGLSPWAVGPAAVALAVAVGLGLARGGDRAIRAPLGLALALLGLAVLAATYTTIRLEAAARNWETRVAAHEAMVAARLDNRMVGVLRRAASAAELAARASSGELFDRLASIRDRTGVDALTVLSPAGELVAWAGDHRGRLPAAVVELEEGVLYAGGPLFSFLYVVVPMVDGRRAVAAMLLQAGPPLRGATRSVAERFEAVTGQRPRFGPGDDTAAVWRFRVDDETILHARFPPLSPGEWRRNVAGTGRVLVFALGLLALALLAAAWHRSLPDRSGPAGLVPLAGLGAALMAAPLGRTFGLERIFSPALFVLPIPGDVVMEGVLVVLLPLAALVATLRPGAVRASDLWLRLAIGGGLVGGVFAIAMAILAESAGPPMLREGGPLWYMLQPTAVVLLTIVAALLMPRARDPDPRRLALAYGVAAAVVSVALALLMITTWHPPDPVPTPILLAWALPFALAGRAVAGYAGRGDRLLRWMVAGWLAATAVIPHLWLVHQEARLGEAEAEVASFGVRGDPYLSYLLVRFEEEVRAAALRGESGVDLLYEAWVTSGLAGEPYPLEISLWDDALRRRAQLPLGVRLTEDMTVRAGALDAVLRAVVEERTQNELAAGGGVSRILAVPLETGWIASVAVAPRASLRPTSALSAFVEGELPQEARLELVPSVAAGPLVEGEVHWLRTEAGWRSEALLREGRDLYHAHLELRLPPTPVLAARGMLLAVASLILLAVLWLLGRLARGDPPVPPGGWLGWLGGFRARLIVALFAFFLMPTAVFGWAAYQALSEEVTRAARQVAERAVVQAAAAVPEAGLEEASRRIGEDLLLYRRGVLVEASLPHAVELGLYAGWLPSELHQRIRIGEALGGTKVGRLGDRSYLVAFRRLQSPLETVGAPVWLAGRDVAVRQREFAHMVLFGALVGAILSLGLSVVVGRALARPIGELRRAAAAVGRGRLRVRLPEQRADEFGELFASFNHMTRRLRRARAQELRTARVLAWGEMARQVAHEIKNPLTPIKLSVQHIRRAYRDGHLDFDAVLDANVEQILVEIERLTEIARAFSRYGAPEEVSGSMEPVDVTVTTRDVLTLYSAPDRQVRYRLRVETPDSVARARSSELREVLVNLLENARVAVGQGGTVEVVIGAQRDHVAVEVRDDGEGIAPELLSRIFEPHFSTRSSGTGLGLAIVRRLVDGWGGDVTAESEPGRGTTIRVIIPKPTRSETVPDL